jgi:ribosomal protein S17
MINLNFYFKNMERNKRKTRVGWVVSNRMEKTIVVAIDRLLRHPRYNRVIKRTSKLYAHDEKKGEMRIRGRCCSKRRVE